MIGWVQMFETPGRVVGRVELADQSLARHAGARGLRLQIDDRLGHVDGGGIGGGLGASDLRDHRRHLRELLDRRVLLLRDLDRLASEIEGSVTA